MSELSEIRRELAAIRDVTTRTCQDVTWIKGGMEADRKEVKEIRKDLRSVERRQWWLSGAAAVIGAILGIGGANQLKP